MYLTWKALNLRKQQPELFLHGDYLPLNINGPKAKHLLAFARSYEASEIIVVIPRLCSKLFGGEAGIHAGQDCWKDTYVELAETGEPKAYRNIFTAEPVKSDRGGQKSLLRASTLFAGFPVGLVVAESA